MWGRPLSNPRYEQAKSPMPFSENTKQGEPQAEQTHADYEQKRAEQRKQEALSYLINSGRVTSSEDAAQYLDSLTRLKERLILILRDVKLRIQGDAAAPGRV